MNRDMRPLPTDDYFMRCMKLQHAAKAWNKAKREREESRTQTFTHAPIDAEREARALLDARITAMGEPVMLGATDSRVA
jgi:hypothetical protein